MNANQVFNWRRTLLARSAPANPATPSLVLAPPAERAALAARFMPVGMVVQAAGEAVTLASPPASSGISLAPPGQTTPAHPAADGRAGIIEIDLASGTRLRVDAFVNERALRRVLSVLQAVS